MGEYKGILDTECAYIKLCEDTGKISDSCFEANESCRQILKRIERCKDPDNIFHDNPSTEAVLNRLDLIENDVKRIQTCIESLLTMLAKKN
jgi:hypothetical protein